MDTVSRGFSILELLIALAIGSLVMAAVIITALGDQSSILSGDANADAVALGQNIIEEIQSLGRQDFNLVNPTTTKHVLGNVTLTANTQVELLSDGVTKVVTSTISWLSDAHHTLSSTFKTIVTNPDSGSPSSCGSMITADWSRARMSAPFDIGQSVSGGNPITEIAIFNKRLFVTTSNTRGHNDDFYIYDASINPITPAFVTSLDTNTVTPGLHSIAIASTSAAVYAFVANGNTSNWSTCNPSVSCAQVQVLNITNPLAPALVTNYKIPATTTPFVVGSGGQGVPNTLVYKNGYLFVGLSKTGSGPEFIILDVGAGSGSPGNPRYKGSYTVGRAVNSIFVQNGYAYLATADNTREVIELDITNPAMPVFIAAFDTPGASGFGGGNTLTGVGVKLYLGRNYVSGAPEWYALDTTNPTALTLLGSRDPGVNPATESINGIVVRDFIAFVVMTQSFQIWDIGNPGSITPLISFNLSGNGASGAAIGCNDNYMYIGSYRTSNEKGVIYTLYP